MPILPTIPPWDAIDSVAKGADRGEAPVPFGSGEWWECLAIIKAHSLRLMVISKTDMECEFAADVIGLLNSFGSDEEDDDLA